MEEFTYMGYLTEEKEKIAREFISHLESSEVKYDDNLEEIWIWNFEIIERIGAGKWYDLLFKIITLMDRYGEDAVKTALEREDKLRKKRDKYSRGGRPSIVEKYKGQINTILKGYDVPVEYRDSKKWRKEWIKEGIKLFLKDVKKEHSKATYLKVRRYAIERVKEEFGEELFS